MHTARTAYDTLELLWSNYQSLSDKVDLEAMPRETLEAHIENNASVGPFRIAAWLARQGYFISAWSLWEYYSRSLCDSLPLKEQRDRNESTVDWIARSLLANSIPFSDHTWFASANNIRNLIAHSGGRVSGVRGQNALQRARGAFSKIECWQDGYLALEHDHVADLQIKVEDFIRETGGLSGVEEWLRWVE